MMFLLSVLFLLRADCNCMNLSSKTLKELDVTERDLSNLKFLSVKESDCLLENDR